MGRIEQILIRGPVVFFEIFVSLLSGAPQRGCELLGQLFPESTWGCRIRGALYRPFLRRCGRNFQVALSAKLEHTGGIDVGHDVYIGHGAWISGLRGGIRFENEAMLGPYVCIVSSNHTFADGSARFGPGDPGMIVVGQGTWIASHATVMAGVTIGRSCLVAAGAVVTRDVPDEAIMGGVPAKVIGSTAEP